MLIVCPNCATSYGVEMARLRPASGWTRELRCSRCRWIWQAQLSYADKLMVAADAVLPVRRALQAAALAAADAARSTLPRLRGATTVLAEELAAASASADRAPIPATGFHAGPSRAELAGAAARLVEAIAAILRRLAGLCRQAWGRYWRQSWYLAWRRSWYLSWYRSRPSFLPSWRPSRSHLHWVILGLTLTDAAILGFRADLVWAMPQTASFFASLGLPVNLRGIHFDRLAATAERHDGEPVLIVKVEIGNDTRKAKEVPQLRFAIRDAQRQEIYSWTAAPARRSLGTGQTLVFRSELVLPPPDTREVVVRFVDSENTF